MFTTFFQLVIHAVGCGDSQLAVRHSQTLYQDQERNEEKDDAEIEEEPNE